MNTQLSFLVALIFSFGFINPASAASTSELKPTVLGSLELYTHVRALYPEQDWDSAEVAIATAPEIFAPLMLIPGDFPLAEYQQLISKRSQQIAASGVSLPRILLPENIKKYDAVAALVGLRVLQLTEKSIAGSVESVPEKVSPVP